MGNLNQKARQKKPHHQDEDQETFICQICIEPIHNKLKNNNARCVHPLCTDCMIKYIQVELERNASLIKCPVMHCDRFLEPLLCRSKITPQLFEKRCDVLCESSVLLFRSDMVYCPNRECSELILNDCGDGNLKKLNCPSCNKPFCYRCKVPWHAGSACGPATRDENDVAFDAVCKMNKWKMCPVCGHCIERVDGCFMIKCRCGSVFCYKCAKYWCRHTGLLDYFCW